MLKSSFGVAFSALLLAGALSLASAPANALTNKECSDAWKAAKASGKDPGLFRDYKAANCEAPATAAPAPAAAPVAAPAAPAVVKPMPSPVAAKPMAAPAMAPAAAKTMPAMANEYTTEAEAKGHCPAGPVVWFNTKSKTKAFHDSTSRYYGKTKQGAYMCQADATAMGGHKAENEK